MDLRPVHVQHDKAKFYPLLKIHQLRDLMRCRFKLTNMLASEKSCPELSNHFQPET